MVLRFSRWHLSLALPRQEEGEHEGEEEEEEEEGAGVEGHSAKKTPTQDKPTHQP